MEPFIRHEKLTYTVGEATALLSLSRAQIYRLTDLNEIGTVKIGKSRRITSRQLDYFVLMLEQRGGSNRFSRRGN